MYKILNYKILIIFTTLFISISGNFGLYAQNTIDISAFESSSKHWYFIADEKNTIQPGVNQAKYKDTDIAAIADNILVYQRNNGGWPKNYDMQAILTPQQKDSLLKTKNELNTTFDNSTTYTHIEYLSQAYTLLKNENYKKACLHGIDFIISAQYANGGWPQYFPLEKGYDRRITFNDNAYIGIMYLFKDILDEKPYYSFIDSAVRIKIKASYLKGIQCILNCQIKENGVLTAWGQQHDEITLQPAWARAFEPPCICNQESATIVLFLMKIPHPSSEIINSIKSAKEWFEQSKIFHTRVTTIKAPTEKLIYNVSSSDKIVVTDSTAPPIWTRYYELGTHRPLFCDRNSKFLYSFAEISRERRNGYAWYTYDPQKVLDKYAKWQKKWVLNQKTKNDLPK